MAESSNEWRTATPREDRVKVCQHIMGKLGAYYPTIPDTQLKERTSAFESQAFNRATSRRDYLEKIAEGLSKVETSVRQENQQAAPIGSTHPAVAVGENQWQTAMPREDRVKVCQHIMGKLAAYYPNNPDSDLNERTSALESQAFNRAPNRREYLEKIAKRLSEVEASVR